MHKNHRYSLLALVALFLSSFVLLVCSTPASSKIDSVTRRNYAQNNIIFYVPKKTGGNCYNEMDSEIETALYYLMCSGYSPEAAAVLVGVMNSESGCGEGTIHPDVFAGGCGKYITEEIREFPWPLTEGGGRKAFGIMQWLNLEEQKNLKALSEDIDLPLNNLELQLTFAVRDLSCYGDSNCSRLDPDAMHQGSEGIYFDPESFNTLAENQERASFYVMRRYTIPDCICNDIDGDGVCIRDMPNGATRTLYHVPREYPAGVQPIKSNGGGSYLYRYEKFTDLAKQIYPQVTVLGTGGSRTGGNGSNPKGDPDAPSGEGAMKIVNLAKKLSWPNQDGSCKSGSQYVDWVPEEPAGCKSTINDDLRSLGFNDGTSMQDCGKFVGLVLQKSVDPDAKSAGTYSQADTLVSHTDKWKQVSTTGEEFPMNKLQPGDVLIAWVTKSSGPGGHIIIWIGDQSVPCGSSTCKVNIASASYQNRTPSLGKISSTTYHSNSYNQTVPYNVYRYIGE